MSECVFAKEASLFIKHLPFIKKAMLYPLKVADDFLSIEVIDEITLNEVQKNEDPVDCLLKAVQAYIEVHQNRDPKVFQQVLDVFKKYFPLKFVAESIEQEYGEVTVLTLSY